MMDLVFSDSATYALKCAKRQGDERCPGGIEVTMAIDQNGDETCRTFEPEPYAGPKIDGSPDEVAGIWLAADVGDISDLSDWKRRIHAMQNLTDVYEDDSDGDEDWEAQAAQQAAALVDRLTNAAQTGEPVRIWWSDAPGDACGYHWAMTFLQDAAGPITSIKIPEYFLSDGGLIRLGGTGNLKPELIWRMMPFEQPVPPEERRLRASRWQRLAEENFPLRAMINGRLCSVPADFYDSVLHRVIPPSPCRVAAVIGRALTDGPGGVSDWWYANRLRSMIASSEVTLIAHKKPFYGSLIAKKESDTPL